MDIANWRSLFSSTILRRGEDYYNNGAVSQLEMDDDQLTAVVSGTEDYDVEIDLEDGEVEDMYCTCPYAEDGSYCKHMAAALFAAEADGFSEENEDEDDPEPLVNALSEADAKTILLRLVRKNPAMLTEIRSMTKAGKPEEQMQDWMEWLKLLPDQYGDYHGFVGYQDVGGYADDVEEILDQGVSTLLEANLPMEAFHLVCAAFEQVVTIDSDDDGELGDVSDYCCEQWREILQHASPEQSREMRRWFTEKVGHNHWNWGDHEVEDILFTAFRDRESLTENLAQLDRWITESQNEKSNYQFQSFLKRRLYTMEALGIGQEERDVWIQQYYDDDWARKYLTEQALERGDDNEALRILRESRELDDEYPGLTDGYCKQIIAILERQGDEACLREELLDYISDYSQSDLSYAMKLKQLTPESEWPAVRERLISAQSDSYFAGDLMEAEGMYKRLMERVLQSGQVYTVDRYAETLREHYPEETLDFYLNWLGHAMGRASNRNQYAELARRLKTLRAWEGGKSRTAELAAQWRMIYRRRPAMLDELRQAGF